MNTLAVKISPICCVPVDNSELFSLFLPVILLIFVLEKQSLSLCLQRWFPRLKNSLDFSQYIRTTPTTPWQAFVARVASCNSSSHRHGHMCGGRLALGGTWSVWKNDRAYVWNFVWSKREKSLKNRYDTTYYLQACKDYNILLKVDNCNL